MCVRMEERGGEAGTFVDPISQMAEGERAAGGCRAAPGLRQADHLDGVNHRVYPPPFVVRAYGPWPGAEGRR